MRLLCLHGFLGSPTDFDFLKNEYEIITPDLGQFVNLNITEIITTFEELGFLNEKTHILGYSFGARLGLQLKYKTNYNMQLICLGGHLGIRDQSEKLNRERFEQEIIDKLNKMEQKEFLEYWNDLTLFQSDRDLIFPHFSNSTLFFKNYGLSKQPFLRNKLYDKKDEISFFFGKKDEKYSEYASLELKEYKVEKLEGVGHRILQHESIVRKILRKTL